jgi:hypothetical protein
MPLLDTQQATNSPHWPQFHLIVRWLGLGRTGGEYFEEAHEDVWQPVARPVLGGAKDLGRRRKQHAARGIEHQVYGHRHYLLSADFVVSQ